MKEVYGGTVLIAKSDFMSISERLKKITEQEVVVFEDTSSFPPTLDELEDNNKTYSIMAAILFIDIRRSTYLTENSNAKSMVKIYRSFMRLCVDCVRKCDGVTRQFMGDRIMGVFKDTYDEKGQIIETASNKAVNAARCMQTLLDYSLNKYLKCNVNGKIIECGIGIDYGKILITKAGMYGVESDEKKENEISFVWVGNATNHASKFSDLADGGEIFISSSVYKGLSSDLKVNSWLEVIKYKGKNPYKGYSIKDFYLDYAEDLGVPLKIHDDNISHEENAKQISDGIVKIEELQNKLITREKEISILEKKLQDENKRLKQEYYTMQEDKDEYEDKMKAAKKQYYELLIWVISNSHCAKPYIKEIKKEYMFEYIDKAYKCGDDLGYDKDKIMSRMACGLMEIYMYYDMPDKAFEALDCMARTNNCWVNIREDIVKWSADNGKIWILVAHLQQRLDEFSIPLDKRNDFINFIKKVKKIAGY